MHPPARVRGRLTLRRAVYLRWKTTAGKARARARARSTRRGFDGATTERRGRRPVPRRHDVPFPPPRETLEGRALHHPPARAPRALRRYHGEDTDPRRSRGRRRRALDPRRGRRLSQLAARRALPDLWRDIARKRFGFSHDLGHGFGLLPGDETNRELCRRVITSPEAPFDYVRGRWWRAVANLRRYRVTLRHPSAPRDPSSGDDDEVDDPFYDARLDQLRAGFTAALDEPDTVESARDALVEMSRLEMHRRNVDARRRARREDSLARRTPRFRFFSPPRTRTTSTPRTSTR